MHTYFKVYKRGSPKCPKCGYGMIVVDTNNATYQVRMCDNEKCNNKKKYTFRF